MTKPREWWVGNNFAYDYEVDGCIRVIEYSEFERLGKEIEELMKVDYWQDRYNIVVKDRDQWKANHDHQVQIKQNLSAKYGELHAKLATCVEALEEITSLKQVWENRSVKRGVLPEDLKELARTALEKLK